MVQPVNCGSPARTPQPSTRTSKLKDGEKKRARFLAEKAWIIEQRESGKKPGNTAKEIERPASTVHGVIG